MEILSQAFQFLKKSVGFEISLIVAGLAGAFVSVSKDKQMTFIEKTVAIISGGLIANYVTPVAIDWVQMGENTKYGVAFLMGYTGLKGVEYLIQKKFHKNKSDEN